MDSVKFTASIDDAEVEFDRSQVTGGELISKAGGQLVFLLEDGTQRNVEPSETFDLEQAKRFKRPPRFKRG
jgi:hypothetical protein